MKFLKLILLVAVTMAVSTTLMMNQVDDQEKQITTSSSAHEQDSTTNPSSILPSKRLSRFLAEDIKNPRAADHCHKDHDVCNDYIYATPGSNTTCCNNKCVDLATDKENCGDCKKKCKYTETCCRGQCVLLSFDKRHCGNCNNRCKTGQLCVYGLCNYP